MLETLYEEAKQQNSFNINYCVVGQWAVNLSDQDKIAFDQSLNDDDFSSRSLFTLYKNAGATFGLTSLRIHRNGECGCR
jgi:hypothetical protein